MPVVLLVHCDGTNGSTTFTDVSPSAHALTPSVSGFTVSTANPKFGTGAAALASAGAWLGIGAPNTDFQFGAGQFTVEGWVYPTSSLASVVAILAGNFQGSANLGWDFGWNGSGALAFFYSTTGTDTPSVGAASAPSLNNWHHVAVDRDVSNVLRVYLDGAVVASATVSATFFASTNQWFVGNDGNISRGFPGQIDEVRIVKGTAQYGGAFTPPTGPFGGVVSAQGPRVMVLA